ncbi:MAG: alpha/beta fold hydrolase [Actinomycetota bacterium]|nr:alpha/beta fold hydrolase [Actinomycetota bacterium]
MRRRLLPFALALSLAGCTGDAPQKNVPVEEELASRFAISAEGAELEEGSRRLRKGIATFESTFRSPGGDDVTGYVVRSLDPGAAPGGIVVAHGAGGGADDFLNEAYEYARRGAVVLTFDSPFVRSDDPKIRNGTAELQETYDTMEQWVEDMLLGLDVLVRQYGVDSGRLGVVGYSMGAQPATLAAALDPRVAALVVMAGHAYPSGLPDDLLARRLFTAIDTSELVDNLAPASVLFQGARFDSVVPANELEVLHERASEPKELRWYDADHNLGQFAATERVEWLADRLGLDG